MTPISDGKQHADAHGDGLPSFDASRASPARIWNYWIGGKDHYAADRAAAEAVLAALPLMPAIARQTRRFLGSAVQLLGRDYGIRQFLDIGAGLPAAWNTHDVAQRAAPASRIVYVDYDPVVLSHARALLTSSAEGKTDYLQADLRDTATIVSEAARTLDFTRPAAVLLLAVLHFIPDADDPYAVVKRLMSAMAPGSFLVIAHGASDILPDQVSMGRRRYNEMSAEPLTLRSRGDVADFFEGLDLIGPGVEAPSRWEQFLGGTMNPGPELPCYCGIGRKPGAVLRSAP
jgi:hypothetical protein